MLPLQVRVNLGAIAMKRYSTFPKAPGLEPCHHCLMSYLEHSLVEDALSSLQRCSLCILQPQLTELFIISFLHKNNIYITLIEKTRLSFKYIPNSTRSDWKVYRLTKTLLRNVAKWGLCFNLIPVAVYTIFPELQCLDYLGQKSWPLYIIIKPQVTCTISCWQAGSLSLLHKWTENMTHFDQLRYSSAVVLIILPFWQWYISLFLFV